MIPDPFAIPARRSAVLVKPPAAALWAAVRRVGVGGAIAFGYTILSHERANSKGFWRTQVWTHDGTSSR